MPILPFISYLILKKKRRYREAKSVLLDHLARYQRLFYSISKKRFDIWADIGWQRAILGKPNIEVFSSISKKFLTMSKKTTILGTILCMISCFDFWCLQQDWILSCFRQCLGWWLRNGWGWTPGLRISTAFTIPHSDRSAGTNGAVLIIMNFGEAAREGQKDFVENQLQWKTNPRMVLVFLHIQYWIVHLRYQSYHRYQSYTFDIRVFA